MKKLLYFAIVALAVVACAKTTEKESVIPAKGDQAISFGTYVTRVTKADIADLDALKATAGFGVFAYYTEDETYDQSYIPNFMYNQLVAWDGTASAWAYAPVKYWPNEHGADAISDDEDKISFFAYAPYVLVNAAGKTGNEEGIVGLSKNNATGDPIVKYKVALDAALYEDVAVATTRPDLDLLWGIAAETVVGHGVDWAIKQGATNINIPDGMPWLDLERPAATDQKISFYFRHALAKLNVQIDAAVDAAAPGTALAAGTKIFVREITIGGFALEGALNLNNAVANEPLWTSLNGKDDLFGNAVTIYDGRKNGKEGLCYDADGDGVEDAGDLDYGVAANENPAKLNAGIIQTAFGATGVTETAKNLFNAAAAGDYITVIPTGEPVDVTIVYDVETADANLAGFLSDGKTPGSSIENKITKLDVFTAPFEAGKQYQLLLHLGMNSVKFEAAVKGWDAATNQEVEVPAN